MFKLPAFNGLPFVGNKTYTAQDYDKALYGRFGKATAQKIEEWAKNIIQQCPKEYLENENKFFNECWKIHRDENPLI